jgi:hypothetical protein
MIVNERSRERHPAAHVFEGVILSHPQVPGRPSKQGEEFRLAFVQSVRPSFEFLDIGRIARNHLNETLPVESTLEKQKGTTRRRQAAMSRDREQSRKGRKPDSER